MGRIRVLLMYMQKRMGHIRMVACVLVLTLTGMIGNDLKSQHVEARFDSFQITDLDQADLEFKVFPNPTPDFVTISSNISLEGHYKLSNIVGKIILEGKIEDQSETIDLLEFRSGVYIISIYNKKGKKLATRKIIKN